MGIIYQNTSKHPAVNGVFLSYVVDNCINLVVDTLHVAECFTKVCETDEVKSNEKNCI